MTMPRSKIVDPEVTPWYHCISRCVRGALLLQAALGDRKEWIQNRLEELAGIFSIDVGGFGILDSHLHLLLRLNEQLAKSWSAEEVLRRWAKLYPPRGKDRKPLESIDSWIEEMSSDEHFVETRRKRLVNLGWFMKELKEPLARIANQEDGCKGAFWAPRYKSIAILDEQALLATAAYIDLNPLAAGIVKLPEQSRHTSLRTRLDNCRRRGCFQQLLRLKDALVVPAELSQHLEADLWLCPVDDTRDKGSQRAGFLSGFSLVHYLRLIDASSRLVREGKARVDAHAKPLFDRLGISLLQWSATLKQMFERELSGVVFSFSSDPLQQFAAKRGARRVVNLNGCPVAAG